MPDKVLNAFKNVPGATDEHVADNKVLLETLDYSNRRLFLSFCSLPDITVEEVLELLPKLVGGEIAYDGIELFETFCSLEGVNTHLATTALGVIQELDFTSLWAARSLIPISSLNASQFLASLKSIRELPSPGRWAAKSFFEINGQTAETVSKGVAGIKQLTEEQCWAAEAGNKIPSITVSQALQNIEAVKHIASEHVWTARALFGLDGMTGTDAYSWLTGYFAIPLVERDNHYQQLSSIQKTTLLRAFHQASDSIIRELNDLHSLTDTQGREFADAELNGFPLKKLDQLFFRLPAEVKERYGPKFSRFVEMNKKNAAIDLLRSATSAARVTVARQQCTANIYILLSRVSILYDSSFRLILVPELRDRIARIYKGSFLHFMQDVDPDNIYVSQFVSSLAQKGMLASFLPSGVAQQKEILGLVTASAFRDADSLILFAATFEQLLQSLHSSSRSFVLERMIGQAEGSSILAKQVRVILQYYVDEQPGVLAAEDLSQVKAVLEAHGRVALADYRRSPFVEWVQDSELSALSVFHNDDDGRQSFISFVNELLDNGYLPMSERRFLVEQSVPFTGQMEALLVAASRRDVQSIERLFDYIKVKPVAVDFVRTIGSIKIFQSVCVYQNGELEQILIEQFVNGDHEMFAHRGHSYWLGEHILEPLQKLLESGRLNRAAITAKQRFLSIGACGGIHIYSDLTQTFCNRIDVLVSIGAGKTVVNNLYNRFLFEAIANGPVDVTWKEIEHRLAFIFKHDPEKGYKLPGGLTAILYKILGEGRCWF